MRRDTQDQAVNTFLDLTPWKITNNFLNRSLINSGNYASCWNITNNPNNPFPWNVFIMLPEYNILTHNIILLPPGCFYLTLQYHFRGLQGSLFTFPWHPDLCLLCSLLVCEVSPLPSVVASWPVSLFGLFQLKASGRFFLEHNSHNALAWLKTPSWSTIRFGVGFTLGAEMDKPVGSSLPTSPKLLNLPTVSSAPTLLAMLVFFNSSNSTLPQGLCMTCLHVWFISLNCHFLQRVLPRCLT